MFVSPHPLIADRLDCVACSAVHQLLLPAPALSGAVRERGDHPVQRLLVPHQTQGHGAGANERARCH